MAAVTDKNPTSTQCQNLWTITIIISQQNTKAQESYWLNSIWANIICLQHVFKCLKFMQYKHVYLNSSSGLYAFFFHANLILTTESNSSLINCTGILQNPWTSVGFLPLSGAKPFWNQKHKKKCWAYVNVAHLLYWTGYTSVTIQLLAVGLWTAVCRALTLEIKELTVCATTVSLFSALWTITRSHPQLVT